MLYYVFNYYTIRFFLTAVIYILLIIGTLVFLKKILKKKLDVFLIAILALPVVFLINMLFLSSPFENNFFAFETLEEAFRYNFPFGKIYKSFVHDDYAYVIYGRRFGEAGIRFIHYNKTNDGWKIVKSASEEVIQNRNKFIDGYTIGVNKIDNSNFAVYISYIQSPDNVITIKDSIGSKVETFVSQKKLKFSAYMSVFIINEKIDSNYTIYLDKYEYKPFELMEDTRAGFINDLIDFVKKFL